MEKIIKILIDLDVVISQVRADVALLNLCMGACLDIGEENETSASGVSGNFGNSGTAGGRGIRRIVWDEERDPILLKAAAVPVINNLRSALARWKTEVKWEGENISILLTINNSAVKALDLIEPHLLKYLQDYLLAAKLNMAVEGLQPDVSDRHEQILTRAKSHLNDVFEVLCIAEY